VRRHDMEPDVVVRAGVTVPLTSIPLMFTTSISLNVLAREPRVRFFPIRYSRGAAASDGEPEGARAVCMAPGPNRGAEGKTINQGKRSGEPKQWCKTFAYQRTM
jgi:hypothetical protein